MRFGWFTNKGRELYVYAPKERRALAILMPSLPADEFIVDNIPDADKPFRATVVDRDGEERVLKT